MSAIIRHLAETKKNLHRKAAAAARPRMNAGDAYSDAINAAIGGSSSDAQTLGGAAAGAAAGGAVGGIWGAIVGFIGGAIANAGDNVAPWLDPAKIGNFAYATFAVGAQRLLPPWDIGAGLINMDGPPPTYNKQATINQEATNLVYEMLFSRRDICKVQDDGTLPTELEAACFMFAQATGAWSAYTDLATAYEAFVSAQTWDLGGVGEGLKQAIRWQMIQIVNDINARFPVVSKLAGQGTTLAAAQRAVGMATYQIPTLGVTSAAASRAAIMAATTRIRPSMVATRQARSATQSLVLPLGIAAAVAIVAAVAL